MILMEIISAIFFIVIGTAIFYLIYSIKKMIKNSNRIIEEKLGKYGKVK